VNEEALAQWGGGGAIGPNKKNNKLCQHISEYGDNIQTSLPSYETKRFKIWGENPKVSNKLG
jgi:hypothetical protein